MGAFLGNLRLPWVHVGASSGISGPFGAILAPSWAILGHLGRARVQLGSSFFACLRNTMLASKNEPRVAKVQCLQLKKHAPGGLDQ